jgi:hypothetical protein
LASSLLNHIQIPINSYNCVRDAFHKLPADYFGPPFAKWPGFSKSLESKQTDKIIDVIMNLPSSKKKRKISMNQDKLYSF